MEGEYRYLSKSQFAASQGWSASYVTKLKDQGRLVFNDDGKLVDVPATLAILKRTQDPGKESVRQHHADERSEKHVGSHVKFNAPPGDDQATDKSAVNNPKYWDAKARREEYQIKTGTSFPSFDGLRINCPSDKRESRIGRHCKRLQLRAKRGRKIGRAHV